MGGLIQTKEKSSTPAFKLRPDATYFLFVKPQNKEMIELQRLLVAYSELFFICPQQRELMNGFSARLLLIKTPSC